MGHVKATSIGVKVGKGGEVRHFNVPSVGAGGKRLTPGQMKARAQAKAGKSPGFGTPGEADRANRRASAAGGRKRGKRMASQVAAASRSKKGARRKR